MKKKIKIILTLWLGMSCNIVFNNVYAISNCKTVSECLESVVEVDNKLVTENEKLAQENLVLKKEIRELQNRFNCLVDLDSSIPNISSEQSEEIPNIADYNGAHDHNTGYCAKEHNWGTCTYDMVVRNGINDHKYINMLANKINEIIKKIAVIEKTLKDSAKCK
jgi:hypothetical protein